MEIDARYLAAIKRQLVSEGVPAIGAVNVAGAQSAAFQIVELTEHEQRTITGAVLVAIRDAVFLFAMRWALAESMSSTIPLGERRP